MNYKFWLIANKYSDSVTFHFKNEEIKHWSFTLNFTLPVESLWAVQIHTETITTCFRRDSFSQVRICMQVATHLVNDVTGGPGSRHAASFCD